MTKNQVLSEKMNMTKKKQVLKIGSRWVFFYRHSYGNESGLTCVTFETDNNRRYLQRTRCQFRVEKCFLLLFISVICR